MIADAVIRGIYEAAFTIETDVPLKAYGSESIVLHNEDKQISALGQTKGPLEPMRMTYC